MNIISAWLRRYFSDPQVVYLAIFLLVGLGIVLLAGNILAPVLISLVIAYLLEGVIRALVRVSWPRFVAVVVVFLGFLCFLFVILFGLLPLLSQQISQLLQQQFPQMIVDGRTLLLELPQRYPDFVSVAQVDEVIETIRREVTGLGQYLLSISLSSVTSLITWGVFLILMPLLVFFFLKDKAIILGWIAQFLPKERALVSGIWQDVDAQIGNYIRGKFWEILVLGLATFVTFQLLGMDYAMLLGALVGISVIIPYVGAVVVTIPVILIAFFQWGWGSEFVWLVSAYMILQALDGNVLVPLLFSEVVHLHPIAIIVSIVFFGGLWGVLGVFFAIPLATLVNAIIVASPRLSREALPPQPSHS